MHTAVSYLCWLTVSRKVQANEIAKIPVVGLFLSGYFFIPDAKSD